MGRAWSGSLRHIVFAGEPINHKALRRFQPYAPEVDLHNWYGPTRRMSAAFTGSPIPTWPARTASPSAERVPMRSCLISAEAGELLVAGASLMIGYWNRDEATERAMYRDAGGTRFYRTGDFVRHNAQGELIFLGRRDRQVKVQGRRIQLDEIESTCRSICQRRDRLHPDQARWRRSLHRGGDRGRGRERRRGQAPGRRQVALFMRPERISVF